MSDPQVFDRERLLKRIGGDEDLAMELVAIFLDDVPRRITAIAAAIESKARDVVKREAHTVVSASAQLSANGICELCRSMEAAAEKADPDRLRALLADLEVEFERFRNLVRGA